MVLTRSTSQSPVKKAITGAARSSITNKDTTKAKADGKHFKSEEPLRVVIAPRNISPRSRFLSVCDPVTRKPRRCLFCPDKGLFELTNVAAHQLDPRSALFAATDLDTVKSSRVGSVSNGYVNKNATYTTATPYDLAFTLLPIAADSSKAGLFQSLDDLLDTADDLYDLKYVIQHNSEAAEVAMEQICDVVEAGDEKMFRFNRDKTLSMLVAKAQRVSKTGLPASMEDKFVSRVLEAPVLSIKREESTISIVTSESQQLPEMEDLTDSQSSIHSTAPSVFSEVSAATSITTVTPTPDSVSQSSISDEVVSLQRLSVAFSFICASYLPPSLARELKATLRSPTSPVDMTSLNTYLAKIALLRAEAAASNDMSSFSRKRGGLEDEEAAEERAEKKRRLEEEEKRKKANTSRGVKDLAKVNVTGMKKMSSFFTKLPAKAK